LVILGIAVSGGPAIAATPVSDPPAKVDITATADGQHFIHDTAERFTKSGYPTDPATLAAYRLADDAVVVAPRASVVADERASGGGIHVSVSLAPGNRSEPQNGSISPMVIGWQRSGGGCYGSLYRGASHMDTCSTLYWMADDCDSANNYWRADLTSTMFAAGQTLSWGWIAADQDAGPQMYFAGANSWSPAQDLNLSCQTVGLSVTVLGIGGGFSTMACESWDISKSAGTALGYFKNQWSWGSFLPGKNIDRQVALEIATSSAQSGGNVTFGFSWDFAAY
jgi:hypothetical protein